LLLDTTGAAGIEMAYVVLLRGKWDILDQLADEVTRRRASATSSPTFDTLNACPSALLTPLWPAGRRQWLGVCGAPVTVA
jgi:hypothetical protein